jgi:hypothetical protein
MSCNSNNGSINKTFIIEGFSPDSNCSGFSTNLIISCSGNTSIGLSNNNIILSGNVIPVTTDVYSVGSTTKRFRDVNTISGTSTVWTSTNQVITPNLNLGLDSSGNTRVITANNSLIQNDILSGGGY